MSLFFDQCGVIEVHDAISLCAFSARASVLSHYIAQSDSPQNPPVTRTSPPEHVPVTGGVVFPVEQSAHDGAHDWEAITDSSCDAGAIPRA